ncbi:hypothetical protein [Poseidonibacter ostreae]|uniref:DNA repair protein Rad50 n=1 Tax=Poseidonibacter ostreae TaxID=2654171 RepID=A0A6L4WQK7_9BACT|nr:hypothetical protein [Poseidonibacter ostreae]KAB7885298.1 hypothetical protein GBG19_14355 [Poseidonibacter ostreae]MAC82673.1 hypothetical protein [Arcobacter sp.]
MSKITELEKLLKEDVIPEIDENIDELMDIVDGKKSTKEDKDELKYMEDIKLYFDEVLLDIESNNLKDEDAVEILEVLEEMRIDK